ncbi:MAG: PAC2 family protein [Candidatus Bathyarchaeota archaeon]|nr:PAC2 family protein [Candidatus Bathyarchaeota archaeon]
MSTKGFSIVEETSIPSIKQCLIGMPDTGLTGMIAISHIIQSLDLKEIGHFESELLPPVIVIHKGEPKRPVRIFGNENLVAITSETPLNSASMYPLAESMIKWLNEKKIELLITVSGLATQNRMEIQNPVVYGVSTSIDKEQIFNKAGIRLLKEGFMVGPNALILKECMAKNLKNIVLLAQSHYQYPDPGAAAAAIYSLNKLLDISVDVQKLLSQAEEIRLKTRELMQRTNKSLQGMEKSQELELPAMYG